VTILPYAGNGKFAKEVDTVKMVHVAEQIEESGWQPPSHYIDLPKPGRRRQPRVSAALPTGLPQCRWSGRRPLGRL